MKKRLLIVLLPCCLSFVTYGQDVQRFAERGGLGTARYVGMGGAMTAIGGDPSAAMDNPAGLGLYRHSEISITLDETIDRTQQVGSDDIYQRTRLTVPQITAIWAWGNPKKQTGVIYNNLLFSYNRLQSFNRDIRIQGKDLGLLQTICAKTNLLPEQDILNLPWDSPEIGWLSILGFETYLIDPIENDLWIPSIQLNTGGLEVSETGISDQYTLSWAGNINNQWYVGASLNVPTISYTKHISLLEYDNSNSAELKSMFHASGIGMSATVGLIARPLECLRIGASMQTPTRLSLSVQTEGDMYSTINAQSKKLLTPASGVINMSYASPLRSSISIAGQWKNIGMLALQYDYAHAIRDKESGISPMLDVHTLRAGLEAQIYNGLYFNAGYIYESTFEQEDPIVSLDYNSIRTDTDYRYTQSSQYASAGISYRSNIVVAQLAYQYGWQTIHQYASEEQVLPYDVNTCTHRIVATLAWRF